jgi:hypothetical protein
LRFAIDQREKAREQEQVSEEENNSGRKKRDVYQWLQFFFRTSILDREENENEQ